MKYVELGTTGEQVSLVALGCMSLTPSAKERSIATVHRAYELGITLYDTADIYGDGESEKLLGEAIREGNIPREKVIIASKCAALRYENVYTWNLSAAYIKECCEGSLKRLGMDYIDLYQPHRIDYLAHPEETARALEDLKAEGKIRQVGVSNYTPDEIRAISAYTRVEALQTLFHLLIQEPLEGGLAAVCLEKKMNMLCYSPLAGGLLTGNKPLPHTFDQGFGDWQEQREQGVVAQVKIVADRYGVTPGQISLAWLMALPGGVIPLVGTGNPDHIAEGATAADIELARDDWYELTIIGRGRRMRWRGRPYVYLKDR